MPRVPRYESRVRPADMPTPSLRVDPGNTFTAAGESLQQAGALVTKTALDIRDSERRSGERSRVARDKASAAAVAEADAQLSSTFNQEFFTAPDALMKKVGDDALPRGQRALEVLEARAAELGQGLVDPEAQRVFGLRARGLLEDARRREAGHVDQQIQVARTAKARLAESEGLVAIANGYEDPQGLELQLARIETAMSTAANTPEDAARLAADTRRKGNMVALEAAVAAGKLEWAEARLAVVGDSLGADAEKVQRVVTAAKASRAAEQAAGGIVDGSRDKRTGWVDEGRAWAQVDAAPEKEREELRKRVAQRIAEARATERDAIGGVYDKTFTGYLRGGMAGVNVVDREWLIERAPKEWRALQQMARADADRFRARSGERESTADTPEEQAGFIDTLREMKAYPERFREMSAAQLAAYANENGRQVSSRSMRSLGTELAGLQGREQKAEEKGGQVGEGEWKRTVDTAIQGLGPAMKDKRKQTAARAYLNDKRLEYQNANNGAAPPREQVSRWTLEAFTKSEDPGWFRGDKFGFEQKPGVQYAPLPAEKQPFLPARAALAPDETVIVDGLDLTQEPEAGSFGVDEGGAGWKPPPATTTTTADMEAARSLLRSRGVAPTDENAQRLLDAAAKRRAAGATNGGDGQR